MENPKHLEYLNVLRAIEDVPFNVGKNLLIDFLQGNLENESIKRNRLDKKPLFGFFQLSARAEIEDTIENLLHNDIIRYKPLQDNKFMKVIAITEKGRKEISNPSLFKKKLFANFILNEAEITKEDKMMFEAFDFFLKPYNDQQKKAIVSNKKRILCIAGAGSGKTTALTKRIEFLTTFKSAAPENILAVAFTRKARTEMASRISKSQYCNGVMAETFNSFCEKIIKKHGGLIYGKPARVMSYGDRIRIFKTALNENGIDANAAVEQYFSSGQRRGRTNDELIKMLMNDCYNILDLYKTNDIRLEEMKNPLLTSDSTEQKNIEMIYKICNFIESFMKKFSLRDYSDQIAHCIKFFEAHAELIPKFEHILVDEYQDVNSLQIRLIDLLNPENLFCVGDPRQSIFGWRGSKIKYILNFEDKYPGCEIIALSTNYRSSKQIVELINKSLENTRLPELKSSLGNASPRGLTNDSEKTSPRGLTNDSEKNAEIALLNFDSEDEEMGFVAAKILELDLPRNQIFVLARTNRIISELSQRMKLRGIKHLVRTDELNRDGEASSDEVTLATVHSIKGLEASAVFVIGCTGFNFPCKASEHPIIELVKIDDYDKEEEERRLFYVALSRAKNTLYLTYSGKNHTRFINSKMLEIAKKVDAAPQIKLDYSYKTVHKSSNSDIDILSALKNWRTELSRSLNLPPYIIMHDKTMLEIVSKCPASLEELSKIKGIGPAKLERYGKEIVGMVRGKGQD